MTRLSVNVNKIATLRNARGGNAPDVIARSTTIQSLVLKGLQCTQDPMSGTSPTLMFGIEGPVRTEFNIEGYPSEGFLALVCEVKPEQVTLVPDGPNVLTSNQDGWAECASACSKESSAIERKRDAC